MLEGDAAREAVASAASSAVCSSAAPGSGDALACTGGVGGHTSCERDVAAPVAGAALASPVASSSFHTSTAAMPAATSARSTAATSKGACERGAPSAVSAVMSGVPFDGVACDAPA